ncbi:TylF/MycF/NovP-related O-methyltransferase [Agrobacterium rubi]|uniref:Methyltransferase n=1 Tax=Agrobacterium rubi TaxID=28099 RepID=A0AAE7R5R8_9HYPH|nr:TylF/MycF/NovP-related O-methyltransferase [Agrobacterium rubi]NTE87883.1 methyltransferase [Agrobacterium rubi]NTF05119.1 methyltransferase [Agrobacterium rubi]NTF37976.1 methyltransferase [Agrobacterium rubi]OCJ54225.1 hypothetical protein A6U92_23165 [Agrobacterium rubi]QTG01831.1 methyltransferase [Agrobacterium rubi]
MPSNITNLFWGLEDKDRALSAIMDAISPLDKDGVFCGDNLIVFGRNLSFLGDEKFINAFKKIISDDNYIGYGIMWRIYFYCWCAKSSLNKKGDFVECGVSTGTSSAIMCDFLDINSHEKFLYLYDAWGSDTRVNSLAYGFNDNTYEEVKNRFSPYKNVRLIKGFVPETFSISCPEKISFLHIDLNNADAEIAVLDALFERVIDGGLILFDDYGANGFLTSKIAEDEWMEKRGYSIMELPTGQGLLIK